MILKPLLIAATLALFGTPVAQADAATSTSTSTNWSGYVAHGSGVHFRYVASLWTQPKATCTPGNPTYSAVWVGLGGYSLTSKALEQVGTEVDCTASGHTVSTAWYELVPAPSTGIRMTVHPGDLMAGRVSVAGNSVTVALTDRTRHKAFIKTMPASSLDLTSADWIVEAPSECNGDGTNCQALPLANFGTEKFARAAVQTTHRQNGAISSSLWGTNAITLIPGGGGQHYTGYVSASQGQSAPSPLLDSGSSFSLTYSPLTPPPVGTPQLPLTQARMSSSRNSSPGVRLQPGGARR
jgi:hypothetical protein